MTIRRDEKRHIVVICDRADSRRCHERIATGQADFGNAIRAAKATGWRVFALRPGPGYMHVCPQCTTPR
jgi:hypothetical protein